LRGYRGHHKVQGFPAQKLGKAFDHYDMGAWDVMASRR